MVVVRSEVFDGRGEETPARHAGTGVMTFTRLPRDVSDADEGPRRREVGVRHTMSDDQARFDQSPADKMGLLEIEPGVLELEKSPYVLNSFGTVNGGATAITVACAAESAVGGGVATDLSVRYVGRAGEGPVRTASRAMADYGGYVSVDIELVDTSNNDGLVALATVGVAKPE